MQDRSPEAQKSLADRLGFIGATFYHLESANLGVDSITTFRTETADFDPKNIKTLIIDLDGVVFMNSRGVEALLALRSKFEKAGSKIVLLDLGEQPKEKLDQIGVLDIFSQFDSNK